ncbi:hypothetical protein NP233_g7815 [Leucocoprinus birnbaumii]|uniref:Glycoside hydrolase family 43 protein n=1 Tax=Leucocoprinus birnbaumii TaxID=56174 RepID=A0AAD5VNF6_9AGAR|nr:hypothetical protein NP233_g7815 [Leucocoprinus birnbaumii]
MFGASHLGLLVTLAGALCGFAFAVPTAPSNITSTTPALSLEMFKRAVSAPYVFTAFTSASESNLYVYTSNDGTNFSLLKGPAYTPPTGLIRDPSVILHTDGKYYIAYTTDWTGTNFAIASSSNLVNWSLVATIPTSSSVITPVNTWAPEFFKDPRTGQLNIVVSLSTGSYGPFLPYVFTARDSTLKSWSGPVVMSGISNAGLGYIDTFPVFYNNQYHIFSKAESNDKKHIEHAVASSLTGPYSFVQTGDFAGWGQAEGGCVTVLPNGKFRLNTFPRTEHSADARKPGKYIYSDSSDLYTWSAYQTLPSLSGVLIAEMPFFWSSNDELSTPTRIEIEVQVETQVEVDYGHVGQVADTEPGSGSGEDRLSLDSYSHGSSQPHSAPLLHRPSTSTAVTSSLYHTSPYLKHSPWNSHTMSLPRSNYDPRRVCLNPCPNFTLGKHRRTVGVYLAGALFALANWTFLDAAVLSAHAKPRWGDEVPVHVTFVDWVPGICSLLGYLVINLIDKDRIRGEDGGFSDGDSRAVWRARVFLFIGFALMAGGLAGSVTVLILKYILPGYLPQFTYYGYANVSQSVALMLSAVVLWIAQNTSNEYEYNLTL